jgi:hypothetical protein
VAVYKRCLETLQPLDFKSYCLETGAFNECRGITSASLNIIGEGILQQDTYTECGDYSPLSNHVACEILPHPEKYFHHV